MIVYPNDTKEIKNLEEIKIMASRFQGLYNFQNWKDILDYTEKHLHYIAKFRKWLVDNILILSIHDAKQGKNNCVECIALSYGSMHSTSDYDICIHSTFSDEIIENFNRYFFKIFENNSASLFDTNIVADDFVTFIKCNYPHYKKINNGTEGEIQYLDVNTKNDIINQHSWAYLKIFHGLKKLNLSNEILHFNEIMKTYNNKIVERTICLYNENVTERKNLSDIYKNVFQLHKKFINNSNSVNDLELTKLKDLMSNSNFYSEEMLYTQGAVFHVAKRMQLKENRIPLTKHQVFDSVLENIGEIIDYFNKNSNKEFYSISIGISKYFVRLYDALELLDCKQDSVQYFWNIFNKIINDVYRRSNLEKDQYIKMLESYMISLANLYQIDKNIINNYITNMTGNRPTIELCKDICVALKSLLNIAVTEINKY